ncbi:hypothetical protein [Nocardia abscessus]|uniref:hypothetical protein n=1 Tax=Nocardia abscessus TaxID=120957 RepID=UPI0024556AA7|nr:hypothetical protein [Nocardia abscessus]
MQRARFVHFGRYVAAPGDRARREGRPGRISLRAKGSERYRAAHALRGGGGGGGGRPPGGGGGGTQVCFFLLKTNHSF